MASKIQIKRGLRAKLPQLDDGELALCMDESMLYVGNSGSNIKYYNSKFIDDIVSQIKNLISEKVSKSKNVINVKDCGAKGDGVTDDTDSILKAINRLTDGSVLLFPTGTYIVYSDVLGVTTGDATPIEKCILIRGKKNVAIMGEQNTIIRPKVQTHSVDKKRYPCTFSIDKCENINLYNITIESKGESYGDADAGHSVPLGDKRTNFVIQNGGSAIFVSRSKKIIVDNVIANLCGSCGVIYHSNISDCEVRNSTANPLSLGYSGFAVDTFCTDDKQYNNKIRYYNCKSKLETLVRDNNIIGSTKYNSKAGITIEGDERLIECEIINCNIQDCYPNSADKYLGCGVISYEAITTVENTYFNNCSTMVYKRDTLTNKGKLTVKNCIGENLRTSGIVIRDLHTLSNFDDIIIDGNIINVIGTVTFPSDPLLYLRNATGVCVAEYRNKSKIICNNNVINSPSYAISTVSRADLTVNNNTLTSDRYTVSACGGGKIELFGNSIKRTGYTKDTSNLYISSTALDGSVGVSEIIINNNEFVADGQTDQAIEIKSNNPGLLIKLYNSRNNSFAKCCVHTDKSQILLPLEQTKVQLISQNELAGSYSVLKFDFSNNMGVNESFKIVSDDNTIFELIKQGREIVDDKYVEIFYINGDVRSKFTKDKYYSLI